MCALCGFTSNAKVHEIFFACMDSKHCTCQKTDCDSKEDVAVNECVQAVQEAFGFFP